MSQSKHHLWILGSLLMALLIMGGGYISGVLQAQTIAAVPADIIQGRADVMLNDTFRWQAIQQGGLTPLINGDRVRTGDRGRVLLTFSDAFELLLLPHSVLRINTFEMTDNGGYRVDLNLAGTAIQRRLQDDILLDYRLNAFDFEITEPAAHFAVWARADEPDSITVSAGSARIFFLDERPLTVIPNSGLRATINRPPIVALDRPLNAAKITAKQEGCAARVNARDIAYLTIYDGAGTGWQIKGRISNHSDVWVLAQSRSAYWTRIQFRNSFGWIVTDALNIDDACGFLPLVADDTPEPAAPRIYNVTDAELTLLEPFFGLPADDVWFYPNTP